MPRLLLYGDSGIGKTMAIEKYLRIHPPTYDPREGLQKHSVLMVKMPTTPDERRFYVKLLTTLHAPFSPSERLATLEHIGMRLLRKIGGWFGSRAAIRQVCARFMLLCREMKLVTEAMVAIDDSKFKAVNNRDRNFNLSCALQERSGFLSWKPLL